LNRPVLTVIAGSNGCGKSTLTRTARDKFQQNPILDPDAIAKSLQATLDSGNSNIEAGKKVLRLADQLIAKGEMFTVETTLSGGTYLRMADRAKERGFGSSPSRSGRPSCGSRGRQREHADSLESACSRWWVWEQCRGEGWNLRMPLGYLLLCSITTCRRTGRAKGCPSSVPGSKRNWLTALSTS